MLFSTPFRLFTTILSLLVLLPWLAQAQTNCSSYTVSLTSTGLGSCVGATSLSVNSDQTASMVQWYNGNALIYTATSQSAASGTTVAGGNGLGSAANQLDYPRGVVVDGSGAVYVTDQHNHRIQKWAVGATSGTAVAGGNGLGNAANQLFYPASVFIDGNGAMYVADYSNNRVQKWAAGATSGTTVAGGNGEGLADNQFHYPVSLYVDGSGAIYVSDQENHRIQKWAAGATSGTTVAGGNGKGSADNQLDVPSSVYVDGAGAVYVADAHNNRIQKWAVGATSGIAVAGGNGVGSAANQLTNPTGVHIDGNGAIYVADYGNHRIQKWAAGGTRGTTVAGGNGQGPAANQLNVPVSVYVDGSGMLYVSDNGNNRVQKWTLPASLVYTPTSAGVYMALVTSANGCTATTNSLTLSAQPTPALAATNQNGVMTSTLTCAQTSLTLTATNTSGEPDSHFQFAGPGTSTLGIVSQNTTDGTAVVNTAGVYSVTVTNTSGCFSVTTISLSNGSAVPFLSINPSSTTLTSASPTASLSATGTGTLLWSTGETSPAISVTTSGVYSVTLTNPSGCTASTSASVAGPDLALILLLPQANFAAAGTVGEFVVNLFEIGGLATASGKVTITLTAPLGYTLAFSNTLTSINVSGGSQNPVTVNNTQWSLTNSLNDRQLTLTMNSDAFIGGGSQSSIGFQITRTNANSGSVASLTVNVANDLTMTYDSNLSNNIYARIISGL